MTLTIPSGMYGLLGPNGAGKPTLMRILATLYTPRDALRLDFEVWYRPQEFRESGADDSVVANGTFFTGGWLPVIGYQRRRELTSASDRRERELAPRPLISSLYDVEARKGWSAGRL